MKILNYNDFVKLPKGTLYCETHPCIFGELQLKQDTINDGRDWFLTRLDYLEDKEDEYLQFQEQYELLEKGESLDLDIHCSERDGMFDYDRKFLIYEKKDVGKLIDLLKTCL